jgi:hypothetical protein
MTDRSMANNSSEQVPGQQTNESSVDERPKTRDEDGEREQAGLGKDASSG